MEKKIRIGNSLLSIFLTLLSLAWIYPVVMILLNALKTESAITTDGVFQLPTAETFAGLTNKADYFFQVCKQNLENYRDGKPLANQVDLKTGYRVTTN